MEQAEDARTDDGVVIARSNVGHRNEYPTLREREAGSKGILCAYQPRISWFGCDFPKPTIVENGALLKDEQANRVSHLRGLRGSVPSIEH